MFLKSWLFRFLVTRAARAYGFLDPVRLAAKIRGFAQPSEVAEPIELLRAGMLFHARGLVNTKAIQNNLDWIWPYWVERQFNPADVSFVPRAFSFSHINLTHRNWTAVGMPDVPFYPIVDPRGLVTPLFDGWSLEFWLVPEQGEPQVPSKLREFEQQLAFDGDNLRVSSRAQWNGTVLATDVTLCLHNHEPHCCVLARVEGNATGHLAVALRPYNAEGVSFIDEVAALEGDGGWLVNQRSHVLFDRAPARMLMSIYKDGDVSQHLHDAANGAVRSVKDPVGLATAVALFPVDAVRAQALDVRMPIQDELDPKKKLTLTISPSWRSAMEPMATMRIADRRVQELFDLAVANVVLHAPDEVYPGPYTYKRFWFRDAAFMLNALLVLGGVERTRHVLRHFAPRQRRDGYFLSQEGEWDSNGEAIWMYHRFVTLAGAEPPEAWLRATEKGARWIMRKRLPQDPGKPEGGLLPAGFSAEHLGPNDFYYWDDFWGVAGLRCAAELLRERNPDFAAECREVADEFLDTIENSFPSGPQRRFPGAIPASPKRRMDSGAVGSLVADYPLQLFAPGDARIVKTADYLRDHSSHEGGFFQNMIHSGINAYLTLHLAQIRLRAGQVDEAWRLLDRVAELASPTGQWPEAIHPRTGGGCMGDGEHMWAAAEWALMLRACFVREEGSTLVVGAGLKPAWWRDGGAMLGPTLTPFGPVTVRVTSDARPAHPTVTITSQWQGTPPALEVCLPGYAAQRRPATTETEQFQLTPLP